MVCFNIIVTAVKSSLMFSFGLCIISNHKTNSYQNVNISVFTYYIVYYSLIVISYPAIILPIAICKMIYKLGNETNTKRLFPTLRYVRCLRGNLKFQTSEK